MVQNCVLSKYWVTVFILPLLLFVFKTHFKCLLSRINTFQFSVFWGRSVLSRYLMEYRLKIYMVIYSQYHKCHCSLEISVGFTSGWLRSLFHLRLQVARYALIYMWSQNNWKGLKNRVSPIILCWERTRNTLIKRNRCLFNLVFTSN